MPRFDGQVAIVTGGALGIGGATARRLASEGASVLIADFNDEAAAANVARITGAGGTAKSLTTDVSKHDDIRNAVETAVSEWGRLDIMVNNAFPTDTRDAPWWGSAVSVPEDGWDLGMSMLTKALYLGAKYAVPEMEKTGGGSIVNMASVAGLVGYPTATAYTTTKHAVVGLSLTLRAEAVSLGVNVSVVCPGPIATGIGSRALGSGAAGDVDPSGDSGRELLERVTLTILKGVERNKGMIIFPRKARRQWWLYRLLPSLFVPITQKRIKNYRRKQHNASS